MGYRIQENIFNALLNEWRQDHVIYAPKRFSGGGRCSDTDVVRYGEITSVNEIVFDEPAAYSFKEVLTPISQTLFYFTEANTTEASPPAKGAVLFMRSCDIHALARLDDMYLHNGAPDYYYQQLRKNIKIILMGCRESFAHCFCVSMDTNRSDNYALSVDPQTDGTYLLDCKDSTWITQLDALGAEHQNVTPSFVVENPVHVTIPTNLSNDIAKSTIWNEYDSRCIACGRCNFVCPTCTCFTMQDIYYNDNGKVGERRRVWASCMVDGFTDVAGGGSYRKAHGQRMRFKVLHKVLQHKQRFGHHLCVGCGRCDAICPEYISFSHCVNKLDAALTEVIHNVKQ